VLLEVDLRDERTKYGLPDADHLGADPVAR
jgi:hypothetical protein